MVAQLYLNICVRKISIKRLISKYRRYTNYFVIIVIAILVTYIYITGKIKENEHFDTMLHLYDNINDSVDGCAFPRLDPFSEVAMKYSRVMPDVVCTEVGWVECNISECYVKKAILQTMRSVVCLYRDIIYVDDHLYVISEPVQVEGAGVYKLNKSDYFKVSCNGYGTHGITWLSKRWYGYVSGIRPIAPIRSPAGREKSLNILVVALDSLSHHGFLRKLPKSYNTLLELDAVVLKGYNIVGDGTPDALFPILSGRTEQEHSPYARQFISKDILLDPDLFIFKMAKDDGYQTAYYEDMPWIGSFQYRYNGFSSRPADHYLRSFLIEETKNGVKWHNGIKRRYCIGDTPQYMFLLNLSAQFMALNSKRFCFTFIADVSHDDMNLVSTADDGLVMFLRNLNDTGKLEDTLVVVMGDHGPRFSKMRGTYQGRIEERMPFMSFVLPKQMKRERPEALYHLKANSEVLTTPFDIHTSLLDAMGLKRFASGFVSPNGRMLRGLSLLRKIPKMRNCKDAAILPHWCVCLNNKWYQVPQTDNLYQRVAAAIAEFVNNITQEKRSFCEERKLVSVSWVIRRDVCPNPVLGDNSTCEIYFQAMIVMSPRRAIFEGSMQYYKESDSFVVSETAISRISAYGSEPHCVSQTHPHLNKYCYCKSQFPLSIFK